MTDRHVVMWSGGITSWATARHVIAEHGTASTTLLFADTNAEDEDLYRWNSDAAAQLGMTLTRVADARERNPMQVFEDKRWLGNTRIAQCAMELKIKPCKDWLGANRNPADTTLHVGIDWTEPERGQRMRATLGKDVSILRDRTGGETRPLTLAALRLRVEQQPDQLDLFDEGGCGCFTDLAA